MGPDAAQDAEHRLHEERRLDHAAVEEVGQVVEVADVVALELEAGAVAAARGQNILDVLVGVLEHEIAAVLQVRALPVVLELLEAAEHGEQAEVHRTHVERGDLGLELEGRAQALLHGHAQAAAGGDVDYRLARLLDARQELLEQRRVLARPAVLGIARVQVQDRGPGLGRGERRLGDLVRRHRQIGRHRRRVDRAGDGAGDDDFAGLGHGSAPPVSFARSPAARGAAPNSL